MYLPHLNSFRGLRQLRLRLTTGQAGGLSIASLAALPELQQLALYATMGTFYIYGVDTLRQLKALKLVNIVSHDSLPSSLTELQINSLDMRSLPAAAKDALKYFAGRLQTAHLHMPLFSNSLNRLRHISSLKDVRELHLSLTSDHTSSYSWQPQCFHSLRVLHISLEHVSASFQPEWNLGSCSLSELHLCISAATDISLRDITKVQADAVHLHLTHVVSGQERSSMDCSSWTVAKAQVHYEEHASFAGCFPVCVTDAVGALMLTQGSLTVLRVNSMTPFAAVASESEKGQLAAALDAGLAFDPEEDYMSDRDSDKLNNDGERLSDLSDHD